MNEKKHRVKIGLRLKEARKLAGLSQAQAASVLGIHRPSVSEIESGNRRISAEELSELCETYDVAPDWILGRSPEALDVNDPKLQLAARELSKLKSDDLQRLLRLIASMRDESDG